MFICRNASLGVGMCPQSLWGKISEDSWTRTMSPFDHKLLDICISGSSSVALKVSIDEGPFAMINMQINMYNLYPEIYHSLMCMALQSLAILVSYF